ncbi:hypothetical protein ACFX13_032266 [Malus domestica]
MAPLSLSNQHPLISFLIFLTPIVMVVGMLGVLGVDGANSPTSSSTTWCVARSDASAQALQTALDYACAAGADCSPIQSDGLCYLPNTIQAHASYAFNSYYQRQAKAPGSCGFSGTATIAQTDPSYGSCDYPSSTSAAGGTTSPSTPPTVPNPQTPPSTFAPPFTASTGGFTPGSTPMIPDDNSKASLDSMSPTILMPISLVLVLLFT